MNPNQTRKDSECRIREALEEMDAAHANVLRAAALISVIEGLGAQWDELSQLANQVQEIQQNLEDAGRQ